MARTRVRKGMKFHYNYADGNPEWTVIQKDGRNWLCRIEEDADWQGTEKVFMSREILAALAHADLFARYANEHDVYYAALKPGQIVHYDNGHDKFVRCEAVQDGNEMKLKPIALIGKWCKHDLPRWLDGVFYRGHFPEMIANGTLFTPNASNIYENVIRLGSRRQPIHWRTNPPPDPRNAETLDLSDPPQPENTKWWEVVAEVTEAIGNGNDPKVRLQEAYRILRQHSALL